MARFGVVGSLDLLFRHLRANLLEEIGIAQRLGLIERKAALVLLRIGNAFLDGELGQQMPLDQEFDHERVAQLGRQVRQLANDVIGRHLHFGNLDLVPVDDRHRPCRQLGDGAILREGRGSGARGNHTVNRATFVRRRTGIISISSNSLF